MFLIDDNYRTSVFFTLVCKKRLESLHDKFTDLNISNLQQNVYPYLILNEFYILSK